MNDKITYTTKEVSEIIGKAVRTLREYAKDNNIPFIKPDKSYRRYVWSKDDVEKCKEEFAKRIVGSPQKDTNNLNSLYQRALRQEKNGQIEESIETRNLIKKILEEKKNNKAKHA